MASLDRPVEVRGEELLFNLHGELLGVNTLWSREAWASRADQQSLILQDALTVGGVERSTVWTVRYDPMIDDFDFGADRAMVVVENGTLWRVSGVVVLQPRRREIELTATVWNRRFAPA